MNLRFRAVREDTPGEKWRGLFTSTWPAYRAWFLQEGEAARPSYALCERMLGQHMPELVPTWQRLIALAGGGDHVARLLSLYRPTPYLSGCSQAIWTGSAPGLVRNYDYHPELCEGTLLHSAWNGTRVLAMSDCLWGVVDGMNEHGLAVSLAFGGRQVVGDGFGIPLVLRYILELGRNTADAVAVLQRVPSHMAYNVSVVDAAGDNATVRVAPDRAAHVSTKRVATNHQGEAEWTAHATSTRTVEREQLLQACLMDPATSRDELVRVFRTPPVFNTEYARGFGTLYTAAYRVDTGEVALFWRDAVWRQSFARFEEAEHDEVYVPVVPA